MNEPARGMVVMGPGGRLGMVDEVIYENTGEITRIMVQRDNGENMILQPGTYQVEDGTLRIGTAGSAHEIDTVVDSTGGQLTADSVSRRQEAGTTRSVETLDVAAGEGMVIPVIREELNVTRREVERGGVRVHKHVDEREEVVSQPTFREEVSVERIAIGQPIDEEIGSRQEGDTLIIPVLEEMLVVEKRLVLKEEIRITKRRIEESEEARVVLRSERVEIEDLGEPGTMA